MKLVRKRKAIYEKCKSSEKIVIDSEKCPIRTSSDRCKLTQNDCFKDMPISHYCPLAQHSQFVKEEFNAITLQKYLRVFASYWQVSKRLKIALQKLKTIQNVSKSKLKEEFNAVTEEFYEMS